MTQFTADVDLLTSNDSGPRNTASLRWIICHTTENGDSTRAADVARYQLQPAAGGSYNMLVDRWGTTVRSNDDRFIPWAAGSWAANSQGLHLSFTGRAAMTRAQWLGTHDNAITAGARVVADWSRRYGIPLVKLTAAQLRAGVKGVAGHLECGQAFGGTDHWDPGSGFPYDVLFARAQAMLSGDKPAPAPVPAPNAIDAEAAVAAGWIGDRLHTGEKPCLDGTGRFAEFDRGAIYWHPDTGAYAVPSRVLDVWAGHRWEQGELGYPVRRHAVVAERGDIQAFQGGILTVPYEGAPARVHGVIGDRWYREGGLDGPLGWPLGDEEPTADGGRVQRFDRGRLLWHPSGAVEMRD